MRFEGSQITLDGHPEGTTFHGVESAEVQELKRLVVFRSYLEQVGSWLRLLPSDLDLQGDVGHMALALSDAALISFCKCFDNNHRLKPLKKEQIFTPEQREQLGRLKTVRDKLVAHDDNRLNGLFAVIARSVDMRALETVSIKLSIPFAVLVEVQALRELHAITLRWVADKHERVASVIVNDFNALSLEERAAVPPFSIKVESKDVYAPTSQRGLKA